MGASRGRARGSTAHASPARAVATTPLDDGLFLALAPMDGVTDAHHRELLTGMFEARSGISLCVSEFLRISGQDLADHALLACCPELATGGRTTHGVPVLLQLLGGDPERMASHAARAAELGAFGIDLNFGCPARTVNRHDGGAAILREPARIERITAAVRRAVPAARPVSVKVRVGWNDDSEIEEIARAAEAGGATWLTIHGRTRQQLYAPPVDWRAIGRARRAIAIPVVANGDVVDADSLARCARDSGCAGFMIGRGAVAHPDLFARLRGARERPMGCEELCAVILDYCRLASATAAGESGATTARRLLGRVKQWLRIAATWREDVRPLFDRVKLAGDLAAALAQLEPSAPLAMPSP